MSPRLDTDTAREPTPGDEFGTENKVRLVTATSLFDGHDAAINIMRRIAQAHGAEVIHLGHNRSAAEIVDAAIQEDAQGIALTSYQGGHNEFFRYMFDLLEERGCGHVKIFGGGGGVILPEEIEELHAYGIARIYSPDDGRELGLEGMIQDMLRQCDFPVAGKVDVAQLSTKSRHTIARAAGVKKNGTLNSVNVVILRKLFLSPLANHSANGKPIISSMIVTVPMTRSERAATSTRPVSNISI